MRRWLAGLLRSWADRLDPVVSVRAPIVRLAVHRMRARGVRYVEKEHDLGKPPKP